MTTETAPRFAARIALTRTISLRSDKEVSFLHFSRHPEKYSSHCYHNPTRASLKRIEHVLNDPLSKGENVFVCIYSDGEFGVHRTFYTWEEV